jgi:hypothetical protein
LRPGTVLLWKNFPFPRKDNIIKPRWFIYLGDTGPLGIPVLVYLCTTTTQLHDFEPGGKRQRHDKHIFKKGSSVFDQECAVDFDEPPFPIEDSVFKAHTNDIEEKGQLPDDLLRMIYKRISRPGFYSPMIVRDIHNCLNKIGITGLQRP